MVYSLYESCEYVTSRKFKSSISESIIKHDSMIVIHKFRNQNKEIKFTIGLNIYDHFANGLFFYSKNWWINIFLFCEKKNIVGVMGIPDMTLEKSENNEGFVNK